MAGNKQIGKIEVESGDDLYIFKGDFSFLQALTETVGEPMAIYLEITAQIAKPETVRDIMKAAFVDKKGSDIKNISKEMEYLIDRNGLNECWLLCRHILSYSMIGDVKKSQLDKMKSGKLAQLITEPFLLENSRNRRLLWAYHLAIFGVYLCTSFSVYMMFIV